MQAFIELIDKIVADRSVGAIVDFISRTEPINGYFMLESVQPYFVWKCLLIEDGVLHVQYATTNHVKIYIQGLDIDIAP